MSSTCVHGILKNNIIGVCNDASGRHRPQRIGTRCVCPNAQKIASENNYKTILCQQNKPYIVLLFSFEISLSWAYQEMIKLGDVRLWKYYKPYRKSTLQLVYNKLLYAVLVPRRI